MTASKSLLHAGWITFCAVQLNGPARAQCQTWNPAFGAPGVENQIRALTVFDDGGGPALYAGGGFQTAGGVAANNVARWDGTTWSSVGTGTDGRVDALTV